MTLCPQCGNETDGEFEIELVGLHKSFPKQKFKGTILSAQHKAQNMVNKNDTFIVGFRIYKGEEIVRESSALAKQKLDSEIYKG